METQQQGGAQNAIDYITQVDWRHSRLGLERITELLHRLGNPQNQLRFVHVAGTNGKGSVSCMVAGILMAAGYKTGLYTSPFIQRFNERFQVNGVAITDEELQAATKAVRLCADAMEDHPTEFELVTAIGFVWFLQQGCDVVVLEVGLGGRLDATNVIQTPLLAIITAISRDHTKELGESLAEIAAEKAGIIKPGAQVLLYPQNAEVEQAVRAVCAEQGAQLCVADFSTLQPHTRSLDGQCFSYAGMQNLQVGLLGAYQVENAALAVTAVQCLAAVGLAIPEEALRRGLATARWPARFEVLHRAPYVVVDGGHNPQGARALADSLALYFPQKKYLFVVGVMADKEYDEMFRIVAPLAKQVCCTRPDNPRALPEGQAAAAFRAAGASAVQAYARVEDALAAAWYAAGPEDVVCAFGSFFMAGPVREFFAAPPRREGPG